MLSFVKYGFYLSIFSSNHFIYWTDVIIVIIIVFSLLLLANNIITYRPQSVLPVINYKTDPKNHAELFHYKFKETPIYEGEVDDHKHPHGYGLMDYSLYDELYKYKEINVNGSKIVSIFEKSKKIKFRLLYYFGDWNDGKWHGYGLTIIEPPFYHSDYDKNNYTQYHHEKLMIYGKWHNGDLVEDMTFPYLYQYYHLPNSKYVKKKYLPGSLLFTSWVFLPLNGTISFYVYIVSSIIVLILAQLILKIYTTSVYNKDIKDALYPHVNRYTENLKISLTFVRPVRAQFIYNN